MDDEHEFIVGDIVRWNKTPANAQNGRYTIIRILPENSEGERQYRIKSPSEMSDRVVVESQISSRLTGW